MKKTKLIKLHYHEYKMLEYLSEHDKYVTNNKEVVDTMSKSENLEDWIEIVEIETKFYFPLGQLKDKNGGRYRLDLEWWIEPKGRKTYKTKKREKIKQFVKEHQKSIERIEKGNEIELYKKVYKYFAGERVKS